MCGIAAILSNDPKDHELVRTMTDLLRHRGPDGSGYYQCPGVSLGHRRLSILDLSPAASQPMHNEDNSIHLVCNGENYNYLEITAELRARGHVFRSKSDSEVLLHLYEEYHDALLDRVNGMYAFAIWDENRKRLIAAVDRFGKKPLYYAVDGGRLLLASEMKALLVFPWIGREIDPLALDRYMSLRYVPAPLTLFKAIRKLEPSTMLIWENGAASVRRYWEPQRSETIVYDRNAIDAFQHLLTDAVKLRMQSDVPLGLYLSGGVDSSAIAGTMHSVAKGTHVSYTLSLDYKYNERERARGIAEHLHYAFNPVTVLQEDFRHLPTIAYHLDEPLGDLLCLPAFLLARKAKEQLTVVLTGDGADETMMGYFHQRIMTAWQRWNILFRFPGAGRFLSALARLAPNSIMNRFFDYPDRMGTWEKKKLAATLADSASFGAFYEGITSAFLPEEKLRLYTPEFSSHARTSPLNEVFQNDLEAYRDFSFYSRLSLLDLKYWIPFSVLFRLDKLNMAHAVETRSPFLDYRIVEMMLNLSDKGKFNPRRNKEILRALIERLFPPQLREPGKQAFYMPLSAQYRQGYFKLLSGLLTRQSIERRGFFQWPCVEQMLAAFPQGSMLLDRQLTALAQLELWCCVFLDNKRDLEIAQ
jgi:asparagine synthase (glutamine-hydrolysing)